VPWNARPSVVIAVGDYGPAIVPAAFDPLKFIAARGAHLEFPQRPLGVEGEPERAAVAPRPDLRRHATTIVHRVAGRSTAVGRQTQHGA
jgi:hypothetical protein